MICHSSGCSDATSRLLCAKMLPSGWVRAPEMTSLRSADLQLFLTLAEATIRHQSGVDGRARLAAERMFTALHAPSTQTVRPGTTRLPVCHHLAMTLEHARRQPGPI